MSGPYRYKIARHLRVSVPEHWTEKSLKLLAIQDRSAFVDGPFGSDLKSDEYVDEGVPLIQLNNIREGRHRLRNMKYVSEAKKESLSRHVAVPGDLVFAKMAEPVARTTIVSREFSEYVIVADCVKMSPNLLLSNLSFLVWVINSDCVRISAELVSTGTTRIRISLGELKRLRVPYPPLEEQQKIAQFLDYETSRIDALIEKQQQLILLLKEKRQAVISHAVTKGLNPNAKMRDSGVEWLGKVPAHWEVRKLYHLSSRIGDGLHGTPSYRDGTGLYFVNGNNLENGKVIIGNSAKEVPVSEYSKHFIALSSSSVLLSINGTIGKVAIYSGEKVILGKSAAFINCTSPLLPTFLKTFFESEHAKRYYELVSTGTTISNLSLDSIRQLKIGLPARKEQEIIVTFCKIQSTKYEELVIAASTISKTLEERRTALISAAVTGKIDVRNWQPPTKSSDDAKVA